MAVIDFVEQCYVGDTVRVYAKQLTDIDDGPITSGAIVTIERFNPDGSFGETGIVSNDDNDWFANFLMPEAVPGTHTVRLEAGYNGNVWKGLGYIIAQPWG
jgi:hypothetical protein